MESRPTFGIARKGLVLAGAIGVLELAATAPAGATVATSAVVDTQCGSLTFHASATRSATETDITVSGATCNYAKKVFLPEAAIASPAAAKFFSTWTIKATQIGGGKTRYICHRAKVTISYEVAMAG